MTPKLLHVEAEGCVTSHGLPIICAANGHLVAAMARRDMKLATLFAAAPQILDALQKYVDDDCYSHHSDAGLQYEVEQGNQQVLPLIAARAALAKVKL